VGGEAGAAARREREKACRDAGQAQRGKTNFKWIYIGLLGIDAVRVASISDCLEAGETAIGEEGPARRGEEKEEKTL
jgi:hypothetical protein